MLDRIIVDVSFPLSESRAALLAAVNCAGAASKLHFLHTLYHRNLDFSKAGGDPILVDAKTQLVNSRFRELKTTTQKLFGDRAECAVRWTQGRWEELIRSATECDADLLITESQPENHWSRSKLNGSDWQLIRHCPVSLLIARDNSTRPYRKIVAAVDPMHSADKPAALDQRIIKQARRMAELHEGELEVFSAAPPTLTIPPAYLAPAISPIESVDDILQRHTRRVNQLCQEADLVGMQPVVRAGTPDEEIIDYVNDTSADLLVMGAVSRSRLSQLLVGNTAERVLDKVGCDVLIVKPPGFAVDLSALAGLALPATLN